MAPGGGSSSKPKPGYPSDAPEVKHIPFFWDAAEQKMLSALNNLRMGRFARYNRFPSRRHLKKLLIQEIEFIFTFLGQKSQKVDLIAPFSFFKNWIIFNDLLAVASDYKTEKFFFVFKFLKFFEIFWNFFWIKLFFKKEFNPPWASTIICVS